MLYVHVREGRNRLGVHCLNVNLYNHLWLRRSEFFTYYDLLIFKREETYFQ